MSDLKIIRTDEQIASEILFYVEDTRKKILYNAIEIGRRLVEAKEVVEHGEWNKWLEEKVSFKKSTANNFIKIFEEYGADQLSLLGDNLKFQTFGNISYSQAIELMALEEEKRIEFVETHDMEDISVRELRKELQELKKKNKEEVKAVKSKLEEENKQLLEERDKAYVDMAAIINEKDQLLESLNGTSEEKQELENKIEKLKKEISEIENKEIEVNEVAINIEVEREKFEKEAQEKIDSLKKEKEEALAKLEQQKQNSGENIIKFKMHLENISSEFNKLLKVVNAMKDSEADHIKFKGGTKRLLEMMLEQIK